MSCDIPAVNLGTNYAVLKPSSCVQARSDQSSTSSASIWCVISSQEEPYSQSSKNCLLRSAAIYIVTLDGGENHSLGLQYNLIWSSCTASCSQLQTFFHSFKSSASSSSHIIFVVVVGCRFCFFWSFLFFSFRFFGDTDISLFEFGPRRIFQHLFIIQIILSSRS